jgi:oxygen-independent coproporphyrinogen-3 oxidase
VPGDKEYWGQIRENNKTSDRDLSLYFHLPFCDTLCWFCACTSIVTKSREKIDDYIRFLYKEIELISSEIHPDKKVVQMHFGGGTPTYLTPDQIMSLGAKIKETFTFADDAEIGCEMDPRDLTEEHIITLKEAGFNRASVGVQDFNSGVQAAINRVNSKELISEVFGWLHAHSFKSINVDLVYGLPLQNVKDFSATLKTILELDPDRFAVFNYAHVPWMKPHQKLIKEEELPSPDDKIDLLTLIIETLTGAGYIYIGMDHFAKEGDELAISLKQKKLQRNFQGYSTKAGADIYAFGMSSISQLERCFSQNYKKLDTYYERLSNNQLPAEKYLYLTDDDLIRREVIMRIMCDFSLNFQEVSEKLSIDFNNYFASELKELQPFVEDSLLSLDKNGLSVTDRGVLFIRNIAMTFDAYLKSASSENRFSKTV